MSNTKRILNIEVKRIHDEDGDTSYLGTFDNFAENEFSINHRERIKTDERVKEWFNPATVEAFDPKASWIPATVTAKKTYWREAMQKNAEADYARMVAYNNEEWNYIGIQATAEVVINGTVQHITSGGLWGTESDSEESYLKVLEAEQVSELRDTLHEMGFSKRAIATAVKEFYK